MTGAHGLVRPCHITSRPQPAPAAAQMAEGSRSSGRKRGPPRDEYQESLAKKQRGPRPGTSKAATQRINAKTAERNEKRRQKGANQRSKKKL